MRRGMIAFDLDGVLVDLMSVLDSILWDDYKALRVLSNTEFSIKTKPEVSDKDIWKCIVKAYQRHETTPVYYGAASALQDVYTATGKPVLIVTARHSWVATETFLLVERFCPVPFHIAFAPDEQKILHLHDYEYFIEDRRRNAISIARRGKTVFLIDRPYNRGGDMHR